MEKTYSQKVARAFEIIDYFLLIPAAVGAIFGFVMLSSSPLYALLMFIVLGIGLALMVGYFKHSRGTLKPENIPVLWITSAVFNFLLLLPWLYYVANIYQEMTFERLLQKDGIFSFFFLLGIVFSYIGAVILSLKSHTFEKYKKIYGI